MISLQRFWDQTPNGGGMLLELAKIFKKRTVLKLLRAAVGL